MAATYPIPYLAERLRPRGMGKINREWRTRHGHVPGPSAGNRRTLFRSNLLVISHRIPGGDCRGTPAKHPPGCLSNHQFYYRGLHPGLLGRYCFYLSLCRHFSNLSSLRICGLFQSPWENILSVLMPTFIMGTGSAGLLARYVRSSFLEVMNQDFIRTARAKGVKGPGVIRKHAFKPAMLPVVTVIGLSWAQLVSGAFIVEFMFAIPGLGRMGIDAVFARDFPVLQVVLVIVALNVLLMNLFVDLLYGYLDPRVRVHR